MGRSSLEGGPLGRSDVKFGGWTSGSTRCQITPEIAELQKRTLTFTCFWNRRFWSWTHPEREGCNLLFSLENFTLPPSQKLFKNFSGSLEFRGWSAHSV
ncbi:ORF360 [White spot syndrome virus]|uniref:ORF360 n=1 Tax=White spot syndrome virus TaxID=342409 RepID=A0A2D3I5J2_9VIRU|nr:ORF360 [White spot syndrome virus]